MKMRPIDADSMKAEVESLNAESNNRIYQCAMEDMLEFFVELIDKQPTIEPKRGHIVTDRSIDYCSECGKSVFGCTNYCGYCGVKLDGGTENG